MNFLIIFWLGLNKPYGTNFKILARGKDARLINLKIKLAIEPRRFTLTESEWANKVETVRNRSKYIVHHKEKLHDTSQLDQMKSFTHQIRANNDNEGSISAGLISAFKNITTTDGHSFTFDNLQRYIDSNIRAILLMDTRLLLSELRSDENANKMWNQCRNVQHYVEYKLVVGIIIEQ